MSDEDLQRKVDWLKPGGGHDKRAEILRKQFRSWCTLKYSSSSRKDHRTNYQDYYCDKSIGLVEEMYKKSIAKYEYKF